MGRGERQYGGSSSREFLGVASLARTFGIAPPQSRVVSQPGVE